MKQKLLDGLNRVAEALLSFDSVDLRPLGEAYQELVALDKIAVDNGAADVARALSATADILEKIIMDDTGECYPDLNLISGNVSKIVDLLHDSNIDAKKILAVDAVFPMSDEPPEQESSDSPQTMDAGHLIAEFHEAISIEPDIAQDFALEAKDHLDESTGALLALDKDPGDKDYINQVFRCFHSIKGVAGFLNLKSVQNLAHHAENILDKVRSDELVFDKKISNLIFEATDTLGELMDCLCTMLSGGAPAEFQHDIAGLDARLLAISAEWESSEPVKTAVSAAPTPGDISATRKSDVTPGTKKEIVKVDAERLNLLIDIIGELVIAETIVLESEETRSHQNPSYLKKINQLDKITRELQSMGMSMRMVAVNSTFLHMARIVRDLADKQNKKIEFVTAGEDTEVDKNIVDKLGDPLVHMVRNAVDHGIESTPEERIRAGKPAVAKVELRAFHRGGNICIEIEDDGRGIDPDRIFASAVKKGLIQPDAEMSRSEIINLVFAPGFSTAEKVTDVSGRGVGMDVVKRNIAELNGTVEVSSELGKGSIVSVRLPLTLAIIDGMVVRVGNERFIVPTLSITRAVNIKRGQIHYVNGREFVSHQDRTMALYRLSRFFGVKTQEQTEESLMLILDDTEKSGGVIVDELIGKQQIVIKSLGDAFRNVSGYSGCAILSDGSVGLIVDVNSVTRDYEGVCNQ